MNWSVPPEWFNEVAFLLACGPSFSRVPVDKLQGKGRVLAINDAYQRVPWADVLYACDLKFLRAHQDRILGTFQGRYIVSLDNNLPGVRSLRNTGEVGLETDPGGLKHGHNSGYQAINLAYHLGATKIVLLGYDMGTPNGQLHWQPRSDQQTEFGFNQSLSIMLACFPSLVQPLYEAGVSVVNCTPHSKLQCWPYEPLSTVLHYIYSQEFWESKRLAVNLVVYQGMHK